MSHQKGKGPLPKQGIHRPIRYVPQAEFDDLMSRYVQRGARTRVKGKVRR